MSSEVEVHDDVKVAGWVCKLLEVRLYAQYTVKR